MSLACTMLDAGKALEPIPHAKQTAISPTGRSIQPPGAIESLLPDGHRRHGPCRLPPPRMASK